MEYVIGVDWQWWCGLRQGDRIFEPVMEAAGRRLYATGAWREGDALHSSCTCPVGWNGRKHSVGVVAAYLDKLAKGAEVPIANAGDGRWVKPCSEG